MQNRACSNAQDHGMPVGQADVRSGTFAVIYEWETYGIAYRGRR